MAIGMTPEEYWEGDPYLTRAYYQAHLIKIELRNQELWLQGLYVHHGVGVIIGNAFAKKGSKKLKYMDEPIRITPLTDRERKIQAAKERKKIVDQFTLWEKRWRDKEQKNGSNH